MGVVRSLKRGERDFDKVAGPAADRILRNPSSLSPPPIFTAGGVPRRTPSRHREHLFRRIAWRLQALAEGDLSERARGRAREIVRDADLRKIARREFFQVNGEPVRTTRGTRNRREQDSPLF
jgi:hypothetical protein